MPLAENFFDSDTFALGRGTSPVFFVVVFWLATAFWVLKDARRRIDDPWLVGMAALLGLVPPFVGPIVYLVPSSARLDRGTARPRARRTGRLEERLAENDLRCPVCRGQVDASFLVCPVCTTRLKQACSVVRRPARTDLAGLPVLRHDASPGSARADDVLQPLRVRRTS